MTVCTMKNLLMSSPGQTSSSMYSRTGTRGCHSAEHSCSLPQVTASAAPLALKSMGAFPSLLQGKSTTLVLPKHLNCSFGLCLVWCRMWSLAGCPFFRKVPRKAHCLGDTIWWIPEENNVLGEECPFQGLEAFFWWFSFQMVNALLWYNMLSPREQPGEGGSVFRGVHDLINDIYLEGMRMKPCSGTRTYSARNPAKFPKLFFLCVSWAHFAGWSPSFTPVQSDCSHDRCSLWTFAHKVQVWTQVSTRHKAVEVHPLRPVAIIYDFFSCLSSCALQSDIFFLCPLFFLFPCHPKWFSQSVLHFSSIITRLVKQNDLR